MKRRLDALRIATPLLAVLTIAAVIRLWQIHESLWLDELHTSWTVADGIDSVARRAHIGNHSPLYFHLTWLVQATLGRSEWALRFLSLLAGASLLALAWWIVLRWTNSAVAALLTAALVAIDHNCIFYSQEARPYACVQLVALMQLYAFWRIQSRPRVAVRAAWILGSILLFWLHYTAALLLLGQGAYYVYSLIRSGSRVPYRPTAAAADLGLIGLAMLPALPHLRMIAENRASWAQFVLRLPPTAAIDWFSLTVYLAVPIGLWAASAAINHSRRSPPSESGLDAGRWLMVLLWFFVPLSVAWWLTWQDITRLFFPRYLIGAAVGAMMFAGFCVSRIPTPSVRGGAAVLIAALAMQQSGLIQQWRRDGRLLAERNQDWQSAVRWLLSESSGIGLPVLVRSGLIEADRLRGDSSPLLREYCLSPVLGLYDLSSMRAALVPLPATRAGHLSAPVRELIGSHGGAWLLINGSARSRRQTRQDVLAVLQTTGFAAETGREMSFRGIDVLEVRVGPQGSVVASAAGRLGRISADSSLPFVISGE